MALTFSQYLMAGFAMLASFKVLKRLPAYSWAKFPFTLLCVCLVLADVTTTVHQDTAYKFLGVGPFFTREDLARNKKRLFERHHPDSGGDRFTHLGDLLEVFSQPSRNANIISLHNFFNDDVVKMLYDRSAQRDFEARKAEYSINVIIEYLFAYFLLSFGLKALSRRFKVFKWVLPFFLGVAFATENAMYLYYDIGLPRLQLRLSGPWECLSLYIQMLLVKKILLAVFFALCFARVWGAVCGRPLKEEVDELLSGRFATATVASVEKKFARKIRKHVKLKKNASILFMITLCYAFLRAYQFLKP